MICSNKRMLNWIEFILLWSGYRIDQILKQHYEKKELLTAKIKGYHTLKQTEDTIDLV